ncbi:MAG: pirin family protein [Mariprofundus sp.]|nr:pirin family protein [Mariprofundus sp.]
MSIVIHAAISVPEGDGVTVKRLMPVHGLRNYDPFVLWDHFDISGGGFPDHPHRGFEAITYLFDGGMHHADNLGNKGVVYAGGAQRFTAGRGMVHSEFPEGRAHGIQLWVNLPQRLKAIEPDYQQIQADLIPEVSRDGVRVRTIVGAADAIDLHTAVEYLDISMLAGVSYDRQLATNQRGFIYTVQGNVTINGHTLASCQAALIEDVATIDMHSSDDGARLMWCFGVPHHESIHQHGPYVD